MPVGLYIAWRLSVTCIRQHINFPTRMTSCCVRYWKYVCVREMYTIVTLDGAWNLVSLSSAVERFPARPSKLRPLCSFELEGAVPFRSTSVSIFHSRL